MYTIELNNLQKHDAQHVKATSPIVEIFSDAMKGKEISKYGKNADMAMARIKQLGQLSAEGNLTARAELNTIVKYTVEPQVLELLKLPSMFGTMKNLKYYEQALVKTYKHNVDSRFQASQGDVVFGSTEWEEYPIKTQTISSGFGVNYREIASGNLDKVAEGVSQAKTDMINKTMNLAITTLHKGIKDATGVHYYHEAEGITKVGLDDVITKVRRMGKVTLAGTYATISQINNFSGIQSVTPNIAGLSEVAMEEIRKNGYLTVYNGAIVVETPNSYNFTQLNASGDNFATYLPEGLLFVLPQGNPAPFQMFTRGGLTSASGFDVTTGQELTRFDLEFGCDLAKGREYEVGLVVDTKLMK